ncbi:MAG: transcriptional regulator [Candidatus Bathyarchaeales archaeon]
MVSKDQAIGGLIFAVCIIIMLGYLVGMLYFGEPLTWNLAFTLVAVPVLIAFVLILGIGAWIGWTMATTPPPKPIEEFEAEEKKEETGEEKGKE